METCRNRSDDLREKAKGGRRSGRERIPKSPTVLQKITWLLRDCIRFRRQEERERSHILSSPTSLTEKQKQTNKIASALKIRQDRAHSTLSSSIVLAGQWEPSSTPSPPQCRAAIPNQEPITFPCIKWLSARICAGPFAFSCPLSSLTKTNLQQDCHTWPLDQEPTHAECPNVSVSEL